MKESPFIAVLKRELDRMVSRRIYFASCIVLPLFSIFFMATIFGNGQMENLPVGVVDGDNTATSREIIRMTEAVPTFRITRHYADEAEARADVQRKSIYGYLSIPSGFEAKVMDGKETALTYYYHYALMSVGGEIHGAFQSLLKSISVVPIVTHAVALGINQEEIESFCYRSPHRIIRYLILIWIIRSILHSHSSLFFCKLSCCWSLHTPLAVKGNSILQPIGWQWQMGISGWRSLPSYFHTVLSSSL